MIAKLTCDCYKNGTYKITINLCNFLIKVLSLVPILALCLSVLALIEKYACGNKGADIGNIFVVTMFDVPSPNLQLTVYKIIILAWSVHDYLVVMQKPSSTWLSSSCVLYRVYCCVCALAGREEWLLPSTVRLLN